MPRPDPSKTRTTNHNNAGHMTAQMSIFTFLFFFYQLSSPPYTTAHHHYLQLKNNSQNGGNNVLRAPPQRKSLTHPPHHRRALNGRPTPKREFQFRRPTRAHGTFHVSLRRFYRKRKEESPRRAKSIPHECRRIARYVHNNAEFTRPPT